MEGDFAHERQAAKIGMGTTSELPRQWRLTLWRIVKDAEIREVSFHLIIEIVLGQVGDDRRAALAVLHQVEVVPLARLTSSI